MQDFTPPSVADRVRAGAGSCRSRSRPRHRATAAQRGRRRHRRTAAGGGGNGGGGGGNNGGWRRSADAAVAEPTAARRRPEPPATRRPADPGTTATGTTTNGGSGRGNGGGDGTDNGGGSRQRLTPAPCTRADARRRDGRTDVLGRPEPPAGEVAGVSGPPGLRPSGMPASPRWRAASLSAILAQRHRGRRLRRRRHDRLARVAALAQPRVERHLAEQRHARPDSRDSDAATAAPPPEPNISIRCRPAAPATTCSRPRRRSAGGSAAAIDAGPLGHLGGGHLRRGHDEDLGVRHAAGPPRSRCRRCPGGRSSSSTSRSPQ